MNPELQPMQAIDTEKSVEDTRGTSTPDSLDSISLVSINGDPVPAYERGQILLALEYQGYATAREIVILWRNQAEQWVQNSPREEASLKNILVLANVLTFYVDSLKVRVLKRHSLNLYWLFFYIILEK